MQVFIERFYCTKHTETYNFHVPTLVNSTSHKITVKKRHFLCKFTAFDEKQLHAIHFFLATCHVCPLVIPESFAHKWVSGYW